MEEHRLRCLSVWLFGSTVLGKGIFVLECEEVTLGRRKLPTKYINIV